MLARIAMVMAIASLVLLFGAPEDALACHKGDPGIPHGGAASCDGGGGGTPTDFVLVDANGDVVGPVIGFDLNTDGNAAGGIHVIVSTPNQGSILLPLPFGNLLEGIGFRRPGATYLYFENSGCPEIDTAYLFPGKAVPNVFPEVGMHGRELWIGTSIEIQPVRFFLSRRRTTGACLEIDPPTPGPYSPAEQLTDEFGDPVNHIDDLYPPPLRVEVK